MLPIVHPGHLKMGKIVWAKFGGHAQIKNQHNIVNKTQIAQNTVNLEMQLQASRIQWTGETEVKLHSCLWDFCLDESDIFCHKVQYFKRWKPVWGTRLSSLGKGGHFSAHTWRKSVRFSEGD